MVSGYPGEVQSTFTVLKTHNKKVKLDDFTSQKQLIRPLPRSASVPMGRSIFSCDKNMFHQMGKEWENKKTVLIAE